MPLNLTLGVNIALEEGGRSDGCGGRERELNASFRAQCHMSPRGSQYQSQYVTGSHRSWRSRIHAHSGSCIREVPASVELVGPPLTLTFQNVQT